MRRWALLSMLVACGAPAPEPLACVPDWPAAVPAGAPSPSLVGVTPHVVWRRPVTSRATNDWLLLHGDRLAFTAGGRLFLLDRQGNLVGGRGSAGLERVSSAVVDDDGNFVFAGLSAYSVDRDGNLRWIVPLVEPAAPGHFSADLPAAGRSVALGPSGLLYFGASDGALYAVDARTGVRRWRQEVARPADGERGPVVLGGIGGAVLAVTRGDGAHAQLFNAATGVPLQRWPEGDGERYGVLAAPALGIVTQRMEDRGGPYPWMHLTVVDRCGVPRWSLPATRAQQAALVGPGDRLFVVEREDRTGSPVLVSVYEPDGRRALGPTPAAIPWGIGADGTVYAVECDAPGHDGPSRLIAYDANLGEQWRLELGASCPWAGPVIDEGGMLYFTWYINQMTEVVAVQTASPGLAAAAWPSRRRDARGTAWVK